MRDKRLDDMEEYILLQKDSSLDELCEKYQISKNTVRRDIEELLLRGNIKKVYGGVKAKENAGKQVELSAFSERNISHKEEKEKICKSAGELVKEGDTIFIDTGSSCVNLVKYIGHVSCMIITNSLRVAYMAKDYPGLQLLMLPGSLRRETMSFVGLETVEQLRIYNIDQAFMAATGVSLQKGMTNASAYEYNIKKEVLERSRIKNLMVDHSKFGKTALYTFGDFQDFDCLITDTCPPEDYVEMLGKNHVKLLY
jgi:transcriptional regulator, DeoR family